MIRNRIALALAFILFFVLAGTGVGNAYWSSQGTATASVAAGAIDVASTGFSALEKAYTSTSSTGLAVTGPVTVQNTGTVSAPYTVSLGAEVANPLATGVQVLTWTVGVATDCTADSAVPADATVSDWTTVPALTGTLAPSASAIYCVRTSITSEQQTSLAATSMVATLSLTSALGNWTRTVTATAPQSVIDTAAPTAPGAPVASSTTDSSTTLDWAASTDNVGVTAYGVYVNGRYIGAVTSTTAIITGLSVGTTYSFTIRSRDAAGNISAASLATSVTTLGVDSTHWYEIYNPNSNKCVDASGASTADGTALIIWNCSGSENQQWQFVPTTDGYYKVVPRHAPIIAWDIDNSGGTGTADGDKAQLWTYGGGTNQQWRIAALGDGTFHFVNRNSQKCLDVTGVSTTAGTQLQQWTCGTSVAQTFIITRMG